jgi:excisionase family DNA binding protein
VSSINKVTAENQISAEFFDRLKWITTKEAAEYLRLSVGQIRNMVWRGQLSSYKLNNRLRFLRSDLDKILISSNNGRKS